MKKIIKITLSILLILGIAAFAFLYNIGDRIVEESLENIEKIVEPKNSDSKSIEEKEENKENEQKIENEDVTKVTENSTKEVGSEIKQEVMESQEDKVNNTEVTKEEIKEAKDSVTVVDKATIAAMVMKNLTASDIAELQGLAAGGLTTEEKQRAKEIAYSRFTPQEIETIKDMYTKYLNSVK